MKVPACQGCGTQEEWTDLPCLEKVMYDWGAGPKLWNKAARVVSLALGHALKCTEGPSEAEEEEPKDILEPSGCLCG